MSSYGSHKPVSVESLAQGILEKYATDEAHPDDSLGSYLVSLLRDSDEIVSSLDDLDQDLKDSMLELLQEHCLVDTQTALQALQEIYQVARSKPARIQVATSPPESILADALSPTQARTLIPNDLLGEIAGEEMHDDTSSQQGYDQSVPPGYTGPSSPLLPCLTPSVDDHEFPPLGTASAMSKTRSRKNSVTESSAAYDTMDPARSRESSLDETTTSNSTTSTPFPIQQQPQHYAPNASDPYQTHYNEEEQQEQHEESYDNTLESCVEYLLAMNVHLPLSRSAAINAATTAELNVVIAQYLIDLALAAPQVCRHYLDKGCYRADCTYSHSIGVCIFWIKGSCRWRPADCPFLHEFDSQVVQDVLVKMEEEARNMESSYYEHGPGSYGADDGGYGEGRYDAAPEAQQEGDPYPYQTQSSFAAIASQGYSHKSFPRNDSSEPWPVQRQQATIPTVSIPQNLWNPHENRDSSFFFINDPMERYASVSKSVLRNDVIDLHFQSTKTFPVVLANVLPTKLETMNEVWIVTGTGHHVGSQTHQKGGGALESAVVDWLLDEGYNIAKGRDRNGQGGAVHVRL